MNEQSFLRLISGQSRGLTASLLRGILKLSSGPYAAAMWLRNRRFDRSPNAVQRLNVPVIAVGNLTTGGTGKTPVVAWIVQQLIGNGLRPGIVSRGYGADASGANDEKRVLQIACPDVPHEQNPDRIAAAQTLVERHKVDVIVCDDAFQHRRIGRDLNIVLIDATNPFGYDHLLPRGMLREPVSSLKRADVVLLTRADHVAEPQLSVIEERITAVCPGLARVIFRVSFKPSTLLTKAGNRLPLSSVDGRSVAVMTAIGNPAAFEETCRRLGAMIVARRFFPDHHLFTTAEVDEVQQLARQANAETILTTLKDLVKIPDQHDNLRAVHIETSFESKTAERAFREHLLNAVRSSKPIG
ncbi:MAG: tetraacyldisaccharide 4'-kinase [Fuerstiella sp.]